MGKPGLAARSLYPVLEFSITLITWHRLHHLTLRNLPAALSGYLKYLDVTRYGIKNSPRRIIFTHGATRENTRSTVDMVSAIDHLPLYVLHSCFYNSSI